LIGFAIHRLAEELRQQNLRLETANRRLSNYALVTEQLAVSRERNRLARELHDTLAHTMSGQAVQLEAVQTLWDRDHLQAQETLKTALEQTRQGLNETRRAIQALRATPLEDLGFIMAVEQMACAAAERVGFKLDLDLPDAPVELAPEIEHTLYRVAEESLRNIEQHAGAGEVKLSLRTAPGWVFLEIQDTGIGFDTQVLPAEDRFGLLGMKERAVAVGGSLDVHSQPGRGTVIRCTLEV
jgi:signal transduction histidine kinase